MAKGKYINIDFPFKNSPQGFFLNLNSDNQKAIKADLMHLILTRKGQRLYNPDFGTNLLKFIFEPNDSLSMASITQEIKKEVSKYLPKLDITSLDIVQSPLSEYAVTVTIAYTVTDNVFTSNDQIIINI